MKYRIYLTPILASPRSGNSTVFGRHMSAGRINREKGRGDSPQPLVFLYGKKRNFIPRAPTSNHPGCFPAQRHRGHPKTTTSDLLVMLEGRVVSVGTDLPNILIPDPADLLDVGSRLGDVLKRVPSKDNFVLDVCAGLNFDARVHCYTTDNLFTDEVTKTYVSQLTNSRIRGGR